MTKDKKDANLTMEMEASVEHSQALVTTSGLDIQTARADLFRAWTQEARERC